MDRKQFLRWLSAIPLYPGHLQLRSLLDIGRLPG
jgi:hypothetical protein